MTAVDAVRDLRFGWDGVEATLEGPPDALRELARVLRSSADQRVELPVAGDATVRQVPSDGPLRVSVPDATALLVEGRPAALNIFWSALEGVADDADAVGDAPVRRHQHIEYLGPGDEQFRAPDSTPLVVGADWPTSE